MDYKKLHATLFVRRESTLQLNATTNTPGYQTWGSTLSSGHMITDTTRLFFAPTVMLKSQRSMMQIQPRPK